MDRNRDYRRRSLEYKKDTLYYDSMVSSESVKDALDHLDSLTIVLNERYEEKEKSIMKVELQNQTAQLRKKKLEIENRRQIEDCRLRLKAENDKMKNLEVENQNLRREVQKEKDSRICIICMDEEISQVFLPCGHAICCKNCINNIQKCPACRANVQNSVMLYFK